MGDRSNVTEMRMPRHIFGLTFEELVENYIAREQARVKEVSTNMSNRRL